MKVIFMYGPPAVGKLTVAEIVSKKTNIPLFHNHISRDLVKDIYGDKLGEHYDLVDKIRTDVLSYCATNNTDLIFTFVYGGSEDDQVLKSYIDTIELNGGEIKFVELTANREDLLNRVDNESRKRFKKLLDRKVLKDLTETMDIYTIPFVDSLRINTSELSPDESATSIVEELNLS
jgi:AAA+ superfamily predicted ATPase